MPEAVLGPRALNRALLARQGLLERSDTPVTAMVEQLAGMQAQVPENPYVALWSRLREFEAASLSTLIEHRQAVRAQLMRSTIHLVTARDMLAISPLTLPVLIRTFKSPWAAKLHGVDVEAVLAAGMELLAERPLTRTELAELLAPRWPQAEPAALAHAVTFHGALVQVPPRGLWGGHGQATWAPAETWLGAPLHPNPALDQLVVRYLAAFGPATVADMRTWSGLTGLKAVFERMRPELRTFRDERGRELFDVPDGPLPDPGTPAPPRLLPEYDNLFLSHADRSRVLAGVGPGLPLPRGARAFGSLLADGFFRAFWRIDETAAGATLTIDRFTRLSGDDDDLLDAIVGEARGLLAFLSPNAAAHDVRFEPRP